MLGKRIKLRALEPEDIDYLYQLENDDSLWHLSNTITPFSKFVLEQYILSSEQDIFTNKQLRLIVELLPENKKKTIGSIDIFDFDPINMRAGIGIIIDKQFHNQGYGSESLEVLIDYAFKTLKLHQLYANIISDNAQSIKLFQKHGFEIVGTKKDWLKIDNKWKDELLLQLISK